MSGVGIANVNVNVSGMYGKHITTITNKRAILHIGTLTYE